MSSQCFVRKRACKLCFVISVSFSFASFHTNHSFLFAYCKLIQYNLSTYNCNIQNFCSFTYQLSFSLLIFLYIPHILLLRQIYREYDSLNIKWFLSVMTNNSVFWCATWFCSSCRVECSFFQRKKNSMSLSNEKQKFFLCDKNLSLFMTMLNLCMFWWCCAYKFSHTWNICCKNIEMRSMQTETRA